MEPRAIEGLRFEIEDSKAPGCDDPSWVLMFAVGNLQSEIYDLK